MVSVSLSVPTGKVAIALATYHPCPEFFQQQIQSLKEQSYEDWICVVSDDSQDEESIAFLKRSFATDSRFYYVQNLGTRGVTSNFENALKNIPIDCKYVFFCDQDDIWHKNKIEKILLYLQEHPEISVVHSDLRRVDANAKVLNESVWSFEGRNLFPEDVFQLILFPMVTGCSMAFRYEFLEKILPFPQGEFSRKILHDHWVSLIAFTQNKLGTIPQALIDYRQHDQNVIGAKSQENHFFSFKNLKKAKFFFAPAWEKYILSLHLLQRSSALHLSVEDQRKLKLFVLADVFGFLQEIRKPKYKKMNRWKLYLRILVGLIFCPWKKEDPLSIAQK